MSERLTSKITIAGETSYVTDYISVFERKKMPLGTEEEKRTAVNIVNDMAASRLGMLEDVICDASGAEIITIDDLRDLVAAYKDGRVTIRPLKDKQTVFLIANGEIFEGETEYGDADGIAYSHEKDYGIPCAARVIHAGDIGKTIFTTREAAEAALAGEGAE